MWWWAILGCVAADPGGGADAGSSDVCLDQDVCAEGFKMDGYGRCRRHVDPGRVACEAGYTLRVDGTCFPEEPPQSLDAALAALPCSGLGAPGSRLDLAAGCADQFCLGGRFGDVEHLLADDEWASPCHVYTDGSAWCWGPMGVEIEVEGVPDGSGVPAPDAVVVAVHLSDGWTGRDEAGLGVGASQGCFLASHPGAVGIRLEPSPRGELTPASVLWEQFSTRSREVWPSETTDIVESLSLVSIERQWSPL